MKFSAGLVATVATSTALAAPAPLSKRDDSSCSYTDNILFGSYNVWLGQDCFNEEQKWCQNYLDNLRNQCGGTLDVTNWQANADGNGARLYFNILDKSATDEHCVENAVWLSSSPNIEGLTCNNVPSKLARSDEEASQDLIPKSDEASAKLSRRDDSSCSYAKNDLFRAYNVYLAQNCFDQDGKWCQHYLENLWNQCGGKDDISEWQASADGTGSRLYFNVLDEEQAAKKCVENSVWLASDPNVEGLECTES